MGGETFEDMNNSQKIKNSLTSASLPKTEIIEFGEISSLFGYWAKKAGLGAALYRSKQSMNDL